MSLYVLAGPLANALTRAAAAPQWTPAADTKFPGANAYDGRADIPAFWSSSTSDPTVTVDLSIIGDPGFDVSATGWTASSTDLTVTTSSGVDPVGVITSAASSDYAYYDVDVVPGETLHFSWDLYSETTSCAATLAVQNRHTGNYLSSGSTWGTTYQTLATWKSTAAADPRWLGLTALTFSVESSTYEETATLRVMIAASTQGTACFDDLALVPAVNFCSVHGHNFTPAVTPLLQSHADPGYWKTESTMTLARDSFYSALSSGVLARWWRLKFSGTPADVPYVGEIVLGSATALTDGPLYGGQLEEVEAQVRMKTADGGVWIDERGAAPVRRVQFDFTHTSSSGYEEARDVFFRGCRGGVNPCVVAPADLDSDLVVFGTVAERATWVKTDYVVRTGGWDVTELPLPNVEYEP